jgi:cytochrome d ubiquinol oxidase subunit II
MTGLDLPLIWAVILSLAVAFYVMADGFDLGVGLLFPLARNEADRDVMMNTVAPYWDGNETWLVLGGGGLFAAFPLAYSVLMPALYLPVLLMLLGLILRGVAFEFRFRGRRRGKAGWGAAFVAGSALAAVAQGLVLGGFVQGVVVRDQAFAGGPFDWLTPYTLLVAAGLVSGYALLGATWVVMKTVDELHGDARRWARVTALSTGLLLAAVSLANLQLHPRVAERWGVYPDAVDIARLAPLSAIPLLGLLGLLLTFATLGGRPRYLPFVGALMLFASGFIGLAVGLAPYVAPYAIDFRQAAAAPNAQALMLAGTAVLLPLIIGYTVYVYWVFRGKVTPDAGYH